MIPVERAHLFTSAISDPGISGKNNEDRFGISAYRLEPPTESPSLLAIVADGIGGHRAGEVAAEMAVELISQSVAESDGRQPAAILQNAIVLASQAINEKARNNPEQRGMGSTCACAWVIGNHLYTASVGDSRIYLLRAGAIHQLTIDHTWIQEAIDSGALTAKQAHSHPNAHVIRRYLGSQQVVVPDLRLRRLAEQKGIYSEDNQGMQLLPGDRLLLCTDGLTDLVNDQEILASIKGKSSRKALQAMVDLANKRGGLDNITILMLHMPGNIIRRAPIAITSAQRKWLISCLIALSLIAGIILLGGGIYWYFNYSNPTMTATATQVATPQIVITPISDATGIPWLTNTLSPHP